MVKRCFSCHQEKPLEEYHHSQVTRDGRTNACRPCACARARKHWENNKHRREAYRGTRIAARLARSQRPWRAKPRLEMLAERRALRNGVGMVRCMLDRAPQCTADLHRKAQARCGGMVLLGHEAEHVLDVHGLRSVPAAAFIPVEDVPDYWVWSGEEAA